MIPGRVTSSMTTELVNKALSILPDAILVLNLNNPKADLLELIGREIALYGQGGDKVKLVIADPHGYNLLASEHEEIPELYVGLPSLAPAGVAGLHVSHTLPKDTFLLVRDPEGDVRVIRIELER